MISELAFAIALVSPTPAPDIRAELRHEMTVAMQTYAADRRRQQRNTWALANTAAQLIETFVDCSQTRVVLVRGGVENDKIIPPQIVKQERAGHPGLCFLAGGLTVGAEFTLLHRSDPSWMTAATVGEALNIGHNYGQVHAPNAGKGVTP